MKKFLKISELSTILNLIDKKKKSHQITFLDIGKKNLNKLNLKLSINKDIMIFTKLRLLN